MGAYRSKPVTEKSSYHGEYALGPWAVAYGATAMQGWRVAMEDADSIIPKLDDQTSLFAVYDGHGGKEVALYCASNLARMITTTEAYASCDLEAALRKAFMECDAKLLTKETIKEMKKFIMGHVSDDEEADDVDPQVLLEEAEMPLERLLARYTADRQGDLEEADESTDGASDTGTEDTEAGRAGVKSMIQMLANKAGIRIDFEDSESSEGDDVTSEEEGGEGGVAQEGQESESKDEPVLEEDLTQERDVFGDSDDEDVTESQPAEKAVAGAGKQRAEREKDSDSEDEEDDFIVGDDGRPIRRKKGDLYSEPALMEAQEIFGLDFDPEEFEQFVGDTVEEEDEEDEYEEEEDEETGEVKPKKQRKLRRAKKKKSTIYDVYEPSELERGHFTEKDSEIRVTDMPERFQLRAIPVQQTEEGELDEEAEWIHQQAFCKTPVSKQPYYFNDRHRGGPTHGGYRAIVSRIKEALNFMRNHFFEVPFIASYRKEYVEPELDRSDLWKIWQWDEKWMELRQRKRNLRRTFERIQGYQFDKIKDEPDKALTEDTRPLTEDDIMRLEAVQTLEELQDVYVHFRLYYGRDLVAMQNKQVAKKRALNGESLSQDVEEEEREKTRTAVKQAHRRDFYALCQENGLGSLAGKFGLTPEQFGENLRDNYQRHETEQHTIEPEEAAEDYVQPAGYFSSMRSVLQGACHMVAMQIAYEPLVRQTLRLIFQSRAVLNVKPTKKGRKTIDDAHPCYAMCYLLNKPVRDLKGDEFLRLAQAEEDRLLEVRLGIDLDHSQEKRAIEYQTYFEEIRQLFYRDEFSLLVEKWNAQRAQAVASALLKVLYPIMEKELKTKLLMEARDHILQCCVRKFRGWVGMSPIPVKREKDSLVQEEGAYASVLACAYTPDKTVPAFCCLLDSCGRVVDFLRLNHLLNRRLSPMEREREEKEKDLQSFKSFVTEKRPDLIVVSAESREAETIVRDFGQCLEELSVEEGLPPVLVELMDPMVAWVYSKARRGREEFPDYPELLRVAVSLGRRMQEPLMEFTSLMLSEDAEVLSLRLHPLQSSLPKDQLCKALEVELVSSVNTVGVDVNFCLEHLHAAKMLPFVCGLGPRKAAALLKILKQENAQLQNRSQLVTQCSIGPIVFINCAGFIRIDTSVFSDMDTTYIEVLDSTRVHPETYDWARKMAVDALEYDETGDEQNPSVAVEEILLTPDKLRDLDLDAFAEELERQDYGNKRTTLYDIRDELCGPYTEHRSPFARLSSEDKFTLLTGETPEGLEGKLVVCTVVGIVRRKQTREVLDRANPIKDDRTGFWQCPFCLKSDFGNLSLVWQHFDDGSCPGQGIGVRTRLETGLSGFVHIKNLSDKTVNAPEERVHIGMTIHCRVLKVDLDRFSVDLTCRTSDLADRESRFSASKDTYFNHTLAENDKKKEQISQKKPSQEYIKRVIVHPSFMNVSFHDAERALSKLEQGEAIFRPSTKGPDHLTVTWKVDEDIHQHIDIREQGKPNAYSLGKSLWIGDVEYEDLDEILARFIQPMASFARDLLTHKCYRPASGGDRKTLERLLSEEKAKNPKRIPYFFSASRQYPSKFVLAYQPAEKPKVEFVTVTPDGFRYRGRVHGGVNELLKWFKGHFRDPIPQPIPTTAQVPSHVMAASHNVDPSLYHHFQAAVNSAHQHRSGGSTGTPTPYTPSQWPNSTPTPQYGQTSYHYGAYNFAQGQYGTDGGGGAQYRQYAVGGFGSRGGWNAPPNWTPIAHTPAQTPGRTPAYTPTQTPRSFLGSAHGTPQGRGTMPYHRHMPSPSGTPLLDE